MEGQSPRHKAILDLLAAHHELSSLEWLEFRQTMIAALVWLVIGAVAALAAWLGLNALVIVLLLDRPGTAFALVIAFNSVAAGFAVVRIRQMLSRPFFAFTKAETSRDARMILQSLA